MKLRLAILLAVTGLVLAQTPSKVAPIKFTDTTLDNGLRVVISEDHFAPVYAIAVSYKVGSRDERNGRTGFLAYGTNLSMGHVSSCIELPPCGLLQLTAFNGGFSRCGRPADRHVFCLRPQIRADQESISAGVRYTTGWNTPKAAICGPGPGIT